jgi:hypothetical protein
LLDRTSVAGARKWRVKQRQREQRDQAFCPMRSSSHFLKPPRACPRPSSRSSSPFRANAALVPR